jgi:hypothetical protein
MLVAGLVVVAVCALLADATTKRFALALLPDATGRERFALRRVVSGRRRVPGALLVALWMVAAAAAATVLAGGLAGGVAAYLGFGAALGGAAGNLVDRVRHGSIVDFVIVGPWPVFNVADAAIVAGIGGVVLGL